MAALDARTESFISLLMDVSGRVRPGDLPGLSAEETADVLSQYQAAHPEMGLSYSGGVLSTTPMTAAPSAAVQEFPAAPPTEQVPSVGVPPADLGFAGEPATAEPAEQAPSWYYGADAGAQGEQPAYGAPDFAGEPTPGFDVAPAAEPQPISDIPPAAAVTPADATYEGDDLAAQAGFSMPKARGVGSKPFIIVVVVLLVLIVVGLGVAFAMGIIPLPIAR